MFQEKRLKKDAGRQRWSPYLRQLKKNGDLDNSLSADERSDDGMTDYHGNVFGLFQNFTRKVIKEFIEIKYS